MWGRGGDRYRNQELAIDHSNSANTEETTTVNVFTLQTCYITACMQECDFNYQTH